MTTPATPGHDASLHEIRTEWREGRSLGRVYRTPTGGLEARLTTDGATLHRVFGPACSDVTVTWRELAVLARAFERWVSLRGDWAAYEERGIPPTQSAAQVYWAPGRDAEPRTVGYRSPYPAGCAGVQFTGTDELRPFPAPRTLADGIEAIATLWRFERSVGPSTGERVGERWLLDGQRVVDLRRFQARSQHGEDRFPWLERETEVPTELLALRRGAAPPPAPATES